VAVKDVVFACGLSLPIAVVWGTKYPRGALEGFRGLQRASERLQRTLEGFRGFQRASEGFRGLKGL
jgi:hypothetical protein